MIKESTKKDEIAINKTRYTEEGLVRFYSISKFEGYLKPNPIYSYI